MLGMVCEISSWAVFSKELPFWRMNQRERGIFSWFLFFFGCLLLLGLNWEAVSMIPVDYVARLEEMIWP